MLTPMHSEQTKRLLADTLKTLLQSKPFHKITVTELVRTCGINRQTFYYHFQDIYALLTWGLEEEAHKLIKETGGPLDWQGRLQIFLYFIEDNFVACQHIVNSLSRDVLERFLYDDFYATIYELIRSSADDVSIPQEQLDYIACFYTLGVAQLIVQWIKQDRPQSIETFIAQLTPLIDYTRTEARIAFGAGHSSK